MTAADIYTSPEWLALVAGIRERPGDDLPRLVAADWLEEYGDPAAAIRAKFIRRQCQGHPAAVPLTVLAGLGPIADAGTIQPHTFLSNRTDAPPLETATVEYPNGVAVVFRRGFLVGIRGPLAAFGEERECPARVDPRQGLELGRDRWEYSASTAHHGCPTCSGTGRVWVPAPAFVKLCRREPLPLDGVTATDQEPWNALPGRYGWADASQEQITQRPRGEWRLPVTLFTALPHDPPKLGFRWRKWYGSCDLARAALSRALVGAALGVSART